MAATWAAKNKPAGCDAGRLNGRFDFVCYAGTYGAPKRSEEVIAMLTGPGIGRGLSFDCPLRGVATEKNQPCCCHALAGIRPYP
jgi:hypothetical protein